MPNNLDADRERVGAYLGTREDEALVCALARSLDAHEQDRGANSDDARENAELACLAADKAMAVATGSADGICQDCADDRPRIMAAVRRQFPNAPMTVMPEVKTTQ